MKTKNTKWYTIAAILFILAMLILTATAAEAQAQAGPATNVVTLTWESPTNSPVPFTYEVQQTLSLTAPSWITLAQNIPSGTTNLSLTIDKGLKFWRVRSVNATNSAWFSDFSNVASTLWPGAGGNLAVRLGP